MREILMGNVSRSMDTSDVVRAVFEVIQERGLKPGDQLPSIRQLAGELKVSPTTVRDALLHAQSVGLVKIVPRSGAYVQSLSYAPLVDALSNTLASSLMQDDHNLFHLLDSRRTLEVELVSRAARRREPEDMLPLRNILQTMDATDDHDAYAELDMQFHTEIARLAGNPVLFRLHQAVFELLKPYVFRRLADVAERQTVDRSHLAIYTALVNGDAEGACAETRAHLSMAYDSLLEEIQATNLGRPAALEPAATSP